MKLGYCCGIKRGEDGLIIEELDILKNYGFDYIELPLSGLMTYTQEEFEQLTQWIKSQGIPCEACNVLFPGNIPTTGAELNFTQIEEYIRVAFGRCKELGVQVVVFGSGGSRQIKEGEKREKAWNELKQVLRILNTYASQNDLVIVIEPLNQAECNIIHTTLEGYQLCEEDKLPQIQVLGDYYHMVQEGETLENLEVVKEKLAHMHIAEPMSRVFPSIDSMSTFEALAHKLQDIGYSGRMSIEARVMNLDKECNESKMIIELFKQV